MEELKREHVKHKRAKYWSSEWENLERWCSGKSKTVEPEKLSLSSRTYHSFIFAEQVIQGKMFAHQTNRVQSTQNGWSCTGRDGRRTAAASGQWLTEIKWQVCQQTWERNAGEKRLRSYEQPEWIPKTSASSNNSWVLRTGELDLTNLTVDLILTVIIITITNVIRSIVILLNAVWISARRGMESLVHFIFEERTR